MKIPLLNPAKDIIKKYQDQRYKESKEVFPVISNQKIFATVITLSNGVSIGTVSKLLGHTKFSPT